MLERAGAWFLHSGIQEPGGGVARYYRADLGKNARVSTEISGYAVSALLYLHERSGAQSYFDAGVRAARFLVRSAWDAKLGTFPFEYSENGSQPPSLAYFFDCGIIVRGLLSAWRSSNDREFLDAAIAGGRAMIADFQAREIIHPILTLPEKQPLPHESRWSASPGCYQLKSALAWHELAEETGGGEFRDAYARAVTQAIESEQKFLPGSEDREKVMDRLHAYAYFLEGILPALERPDCARAYVAGIDRMTAYLDDIAAEFVRSDVYAQLLRARIYGDALGVLPLDDEAAAREACEAAKFQLESDDIRVQGGFSFGKRGSSILPWVNPVSTAFCVQALTLWSDRRRGALQVRREALI